MQLHVLCRRGFNFPMVARQVFARVTFLLLVLLIATGWTISSTVLHNRVQILIAIGVTLVVYLILAIWDLSGRNPATTTYLYDR